MTTHPFRRITAAIAQDAAARDADGQFPTAAIAALRREGMLRTPPIEAEAMPTLLRLLAAVGRGDLSTGRLYEGHVNAVFLLMTFGDADLRRTARHALDQGAFFGIWNTDAPDDPLRVADGMLCGKKSFASGADGLTHAIVTTGAIENRLMFLVPVDALPVDRTWWKPLGMRASGSHVVDFSNLAIDPAWQVGKPGDYTREPWLSAGAIRFVAVQVGGIHAVLDVAAEHLVRTKREADRMQRQRLAAMSTACETAYLWLDRISAEWAEQGDPDRLVAGVCAARGAVERAALAVMEDAERAIGVAGMLAPHCYERLSRDLRTYLRQPNPDGAAERLGTAVAEGSWTPGARCGEERQV